MTDENAVRAHDLGPFTNQCPSCRAWHWLDERRSSSTIDRPVYSECCRAGDINVPLLHDLPSSLRPFFDRPSREFKQNIRLYNKALAFTSTGGTGHPIPSSGDGRGPPFYKIQGEVHHRIGPLLPEDGVFPVFSQLYVYDHDDVLHYRTQNNLERDAGTMATLQTILERCNPFVAVYQQAFHLSHSTSVPEYRIQLDFRKCSDRHRYNFPSASQELALIIPGDEHALANAQDIIIRPRGGPLIRISHCHPAFLTLHFPLLCPTAQESWSPNIPLASASPNSTRHVSLCDYGKFRLHPRPPHIESHHFFQASLLFHELLVHIWAAAESSRLSWIRDHQRELRADLYSGVVDALHEGVDLALIGRKVILPASFTSGPRFMQRNLQNALALLRKFGGSDLFVTFTANPHWKEVEDALLPNQSPHDRPDIIAHVFHLKFESVLHDIMQKDIFGKAVGYVYTVEYQKRGLPHAHLIVFLDRASRLSTPEAIDELISTEIPDEQSHPRLFVLVKKFMIHGPCGPDIPSPCLDDRRRCSKHFPKPFLSTTQITGDSYVQTRRRDTGRFVQVGRHMVDSRSVISYCPYLTLRYKAHINVECTSGFQAVKYIYKVCPFRSYWILC